MTEKDSFDLMLFLPYLLNQAAEESSLAFQKHYKDRYGMLRTEWRVLFHLGYYGEMTARDICAKAKIHKTKVSRAVSALERRRYLARAKSTKDRRVEVLSLTKMGRSVYLDLKESAESYDRQLRANLTDTENQVLRLALRKIAGLYSNAAS